MPRLDRAKFAELRALRKAGKKTFDTYRVREEQDLYEEVDEEGYKKIVRERLNQDDFVVDDNGEGYADDGREDWDRDRVVYDTDSEDERVIRGRKPGKKGAKTDEKTAAAATNDAANDRDISEWFTKGAGAAQQAPKPKVVKTQADDDFMAGLLGEVDANIMAVAAKPKRVSAAAGTKRRRSPERRARFASPVAEPRKQPAAKKSKTADDRLPPTPSADDVDDYMPAVDVYDDEAPAVHSDPAPSSPAAKAAERKVQIKSEPRDDEDEDMDALMEVAHAGATLAASVNLSGARVLPKKLAKAEPYPSPANSSPTKADDAVDAAAWNDVTRRLNVVNSSPAGPAATTEYRGLRKLDAADAVEDDGSLNFFWTDYTEVAGSLCLFGKVRHRKTGAFVSCFVKVDNILRKVYFLPRKTHADSDDDVEMMDVYGEVDALMTAMRVKMHKIKPCTRKYAFELKDVPREAQYLKLLYPYTSPQVDATRAGKTFSHVFGANTSLFEQFVLWKNIMGPCWLKITDGDFSALKNASHCKLEVLLEHPKMVATMSEAENNALDTPPLTLMSLAMRTTFNARDNKQEILALSARIYENVALADTTPADKLPCRTFTLMRPGGGNANFPLGFDTLAKKQRGLIKLFKQEHEILAFFLAQVDLADPDVVVGHQLEGVDYSVLLNRLHERKVPQWSRLGRLRRAAWPASMGKVGGNVFAERQIMAGRLLCDLANDAGKSTMFRCQSWTLTEMCDLYLGGAGDENNKRRDVDSEAALKTWATTKEGLLNYVSHVEADTYFIAALALRVQLLPLTKQLTNLAGNSWARTLTGTRAERNEYILLHEFHRNKYICPDKPAFKGRKSDDEFAEAENGAAAGDGKRKDKYKGGLVFEPEKGLYDKFVLVMDFNSLYPSIIQEFNICFTTVDRSSISDDDDAVPEVPAEQDQGILPKLIATLVSRRRQVKSLMKDKGATAEQLAMWDIKQLALKLTANSMYGCLGYTKGRFYARPLAVLTTFKGREILRSTKELAESKSLQVIYGDTDSVMINANVASVADALKVGQEFKRAVNERYRLLEIDIDNVFRRILLQAKKKYAAVNMVEQGGRWVEKLEVKGLDMKRREYCALSKEVSSHILSEILSGDDAEAAVARIHEYLRETAGKMRESQVPPAKYIIFTQLGKNPRDYPNADSMPQVQVALRDLARGKTVRRGDVVSYIVTTGINNAAPKEEGGEDATITTTTTTTTSSDPVARRSYSPPDVLRPNSGLAPDVEWYVAKQLFPPVERLCANILGTSTAQLADCLGLDVRRYSSTAATNSQNGSSSAADLDIHPLESLLPDSIRFRAAVPLAIRCPRCRTTSPFLGLAAPGASGVGRVSAAGLACASSTCCASSSSPRIIPHLSVVAQVERACRDAAKRYYDAWLLCDEPACPLGRTRSLGVAGGGARCPGAQGVPCAGRLRWERSDKDAYTQLLYLASLFDVDRAKAKARAAAEGGGATATVEGEAALSADERDAVSALAEHNRLRFVTVKAAVDRYLDKCGRRWVAMDTLFAKLGFVAV